MSETLRSRARRSDASVQDNRVNIGPLTTAFAPATGCDFKCFAPSTTALVDTLCSIYSSDCNSIRRSCLPDGAGSWVSGGFYSPGLHCPNGWTTATTIEYDPSNSANSLLEPTNLISDGETAALCCPQGLGLALEHNTVLAPFVKGIYCVTTLLSSQLSYWTCTATDQPSGFPTKAEIGTSWWQTTSLRPARTTTMIWWKTIGPPDATSYTTTWTIFDVPNTGIQPTLYSAFTVAPVIQLVWRSEDRITPKDTTTLVSTLPAETQVLTAVTTGIVSQPTTLLPTMLSTAPGTTLVETTVSTQILVSADSPSSSEKHLPASKSSTLVPSPVSQLPGNQPPSTASPPTATHLSTGALAAIIVCSTVVALCCLLGAAWLVRWALRSRKALATQNGDEGDADGSGATIPLETPGHKTEPSQRASEIDTPFPPERPQAASWTSHELSENRQFFELGHPGGSGSNVGP